MAESIVESSTEAVLNVARTERIRVLHVDDDQGLLRVAKQCLEMQGPFRVDTASSVEEAMAKLEKERYDAVVSDYQMPGKDGLEFLKELRENGNRTPFIMFTGKGREEVAIRALNLGANQYLSKVGEPETVYTELAHSITELAKARRAEQELLDSEERFRNLFEKSNDGLVFVDLSGRIMDINQTLVHMAERTKEDIVGKSFLELGLVSSKDVPVLVGRLGQNAMGKSTGSFEFEIGKENSEKKSIEINSVLIRKENVPLGSLVIVRDITEHKKREEVLRESEEKYKDLFESAMDAIVTLDLKGSITAVNSSVLRFGYEKEDIVGKNILDFVSKEYWPAVMRDFSKVAQGEPAKNEVELVVPAGKILVEYNAGAIVKENNVAGVQINIRDVTERKKSEELLRESEERFRGLFESIQDPVGIFVGREGRLIDYNTAFRKSSGYTDEELKGKVFLDFVHPDDHVMVLEKYRTEYSEDEFPLIYEIRGVNKKEECIPLELSVSTYKKKGKVIGIEVIHRDLTERKKAEMSLRESQGRFEGLFQSNPEAATYLGPDYRIQDINPRFEKLFGYSLEEVNGKHINDVVVPDGRREEGETLDRDARKGYVYRNTVRRKKDGSLVQVSVSAAPIANESGVTGIVVMYKDISDLKNAEKRMDVMNEKLRVVGGLTRHDIRNKLTAVAGNAYLLRKRFASEPNAIECLESIETAVQESERIFDFASAYEKLGVEQLVYVDAKKILEEAIALFPDLKGVRIVNDCDGLTLLADSLLRQLFYNLIDNSLKYGQKATQIRIHYEKTHDNELRLAYEDDGIGISKDAKPKLFNEGFTTGKGSGHGLYLIRKMMDVYGWTIDETGEPGKGARFTISIPETKPDGTRNYRLQ
jgi:PAS domain S-box-containing protein